MDGWMDGRMEGSMDGWMDGWQSSGGDGIPAVVWKHGGDNLFSRLRLLITNAWEVGSLTQDTTGCLHCNHLQER